MSELYEVSQGCVPVLLGALQRKILGAQEIAKSTDAERFCRDALALHARLFRLWHRFRGDPAGQKYPIPDRDDLILKSIPLQKKFFALGERYPDSDDKDVRNLATTLFVHCERFLCFLKRKASNQPTTLPNEPCGAPYSGEKPASGAEAPPAKLPWPDS